MNKLLIIVMAAMLGACGAPTEKEQVAETVEEILSLMDDENQEALFNYFDFSGAPKSAIAEIKKVGISDRKFKRLQATLRETQSIVPEVSEDKTLVLYKLKDGESLYDRNRSLKFVKSGDRWLIKNK
jgi:hypothetical protein